MPNWFFEPLTKKPRQMMDMAAEEVDPALGPENKGFLKPFIAGAMQGAGDLASDMTSPFSLATAALPMLSRLRSAGLAANAAKDAAMLPDRNPMSGWGSMYEKANPYPRMGNPIAEAAGARKPMPTTEAPIGPTSTDLGNMINKIHRTQKGMDRTAKIEAARQRSLRMRPGRFNPE